MGNVIAGTGMFVPPTVVTNEDLARLMDTSDDWIRSRTGVGERRIADPGVGSSDLGAAAAKAALGDAGIGPEDVDALVVATMTPDYYAPGSVALVQDLLGLGPVPAYDLRQQCSGFLYGLDLADSLLAARKAATVLVVGAEVHTGIQPWSAEWRALQQGTPPAPEQRDRMNRHRGWAVLFGDGAGAMVLRRDDAAAGFLGFSLYTDGSQFELIHVPALGSKSQPYVDTEEILADGHMPQMQGPLLYRQAVRKMPEAVAAVLDANGLSAADVDLVVAHQANQRIVEGVRKALGLTAEQVPMNLDRYGNTTAGTLPILYHELRAAGKVEAGSLVCFVAFGAGAHWGAALYRETG